MRKEPFRLGFLSILGEPGSYDPSIYAGTPSGDDECLWFSKTFSFLDGVAIQGARISHGEQVSGPASADAFILGGSYNSVHDDLPWQRALLRWFDLLARSEVPLLGISGGHQLLSRYFAAEVVRLEDGPLAGTLPANLTDRGRSPLFSGIANPFEVHFANYEHVATAPAGAQTLAMRHSLPVAALGFGKRWYSVQFHPEAEVEFMRASWQQSEPALGERYRETGSGRQVVANFLHLAREGR